MNGVLKLPYSQLERINKPEFLGRRWAWVDPYKDIQAANDAINNGLSTRTKELKRQGYDFDDIIDELARENQKLKEAGITFSGSVNTNNKMVDDEDDDEVENKKEGNHLILKDMALLIKKHGNGHYKKLVEN